jgi:hypothetical protein
MSTAMETDTVCETVLLEGLDFEIQCGHTAHNMLKGTQLHDDGPAKFIMKAVHNCVNSPTTIYPGCEAWAKHVAAMAEMTWICPRCQHGDAGKNMCFVVGPLDPS